MATRIEDIAALVTRYQGPFKRLDPAKICGADVVRRRHRGPRPRADKSEGDDIFLPLSGSIEPARPGMARDPGGGEASIGTRISSEASSRWSTSSSSAARSSRFRGFVA